MWISRLMRAVQPNSERRCRLPDQQGPETDSYWTRFWENPGRRVSVAGRDDRKRLTLLT